MLTKNCDRRDWDDVTALKPSMKPYYLSCNYAFSISVIHRRKPEEMHTEQSDVTLFSFSLRFHLSTQEKEAFKNEVFTKDRVFS